MFASVLEKWRHVQRKCGTVFAELQRSISSTGEEEDDDDDDDDVMSSPKRSTISSSHRAVRPQSPSPYRSRPQSGKSRSSIGSSSKMSTSSMPRPTGYQRQSAHSNYTYDIANDIDF